MSYAQLDETNGSGGHLQHYNNHHDDDDSRDNHAAAKSSYTSMIGNTSSITSNRLSSSLTEPLTNGESTTTSTAAAFSAMHHPNHSSTTPNTNGNLSSSSSTPPRPSSSTNNTSTTVNTSNAKDNDPFYVFREDLFRQLERVDECLAEYLRIVHHTDSAVNTHELKDAKKQLKRCLRQAESTLADVQMTVQLVQSDRTKFYHIDDKELYDRSALVYTSNDRIHRAKQEMQSEAVKAKLLQDERAKALRRMGTGTNGDAYSSNNDPDGRSRNGDNNNTSFIVNAHAQQTMLLQHQDETLDELSTAVLRVNTMASNIHEEIGSQNKLLTSMDEDLTNVEQELGMVMGKLAKFLKTKDSWQLGTILCLIVTVIVLFLLLLYV